jgi:hypothetical protein
VEKPTYEVNASLPQKDDMGLFPPPSSLPAPWAVRPDPVAEQETARPESVAAREAERAEPVVEKEADQIVSDRAVQPAPVAEEGQSSASSPSDVTLRTARPQTARVPTARPLPSRAVIDPTAEG